MCEMAKGDDKMSECERLMNDLSENYIGKIFYFCLRKTGDEYSAEDLTQDIALSVLSGLRRGVVPDSFSAYVWQIARNRYSKWAERKHKRSDLQVNADISDYEISDGETLYDEYVRREDISLLRRELAFISHEYRNIVVAYYIDDRSIKDIAASLSLPEGTVKSKLFRARNILKEGMNMAREFGKLSYKPEDIRFIKNGMDGHNGEPWSIVNRKLCKNILLAAYRTPSTAEELAIELGIALPYMEDELNMLVEATLMKKNRDKYETSFIIVSGDAQDKIAHSLKMITPKLTNAIIDALEYRTSCLNSRGVVWHRGFQDYEDMKWTMLMRMADSVSGKAKYKADSDMGYKNVNGDCTPRPNGGRWDIVGKEEYRGKCPDFVGRHGRGNETGDFWHYKFNYMGILDQTPGFLYENESATLLSVIENDTDGLFQNVLEDLTSYGYLKKSDNGYVPTFAVFNGDPDKLLNEEESAKYKNLCDKAINIVAEHYKLCCDVIRAEIPEFMRDNDQQIEFTCSTIMSIRGAVLEGALDAGYIYYGGGKTEAKDRMLGAYLVV